MYWCFHCYGLNQSPRGDCVRCGQPIEGPPEITFDDRLVWALGHPDGDRAILAAQSLGMRRIESALPALRRAVDEERDPYLAVAALRSAIEIAGIDELHDWLQQLASSASFMVRAMAEQAISA